MCTQHFTHEVFHFSWIFKFRKFQQLIRCEALRCISVPNFSKIGQVFAQMSWFFHFSKSNSPSKKFAPSLTEGINTQNSHWNNEKMKIAYNSAYIQIKTFNYTFAQQAFIVYFYCAKQARSQQRSTRRRYLTLNSAACVAVLIACALNVCYIFA